jgi:acetyltransferase-like isoleucine patch superfamily enzyme
MLKKIYKRYFTYLNKFRIYKLRLLGAHIGDRVKSYGRFTIMNPENLQIDDNTTINEGVHINCRDNVKIGKGVRISTNVQIHSGKLDLNYFPRIHTQAPIIIEDNVWLATGVIVLAGVTIHQNSVVAAGSVVTRDVPPNSVVAGIPAKKIKGI